MLHVPRGMHHVNETWYASVCSSIDPASCYSSGNNEHAAGRSPGTALSKMCREVVVLSGEWCLQGYLHGASFDTNGGMSPLEGTSPGAHPMSWVQSFEGNRLMNRHVQPLVVHTAE